MKALMESEEFKHLMKLLEKRDGERKLEDKKLELHFPKNKDMG